MAPPPAPSQVSHVSNGRVQASTNTPARTTRCSTKPIGHSSERPLRALRTSPPPPEHATVKRRKSPIKYPSSKTAPFALKQKFDVYVAFHPVSEEIPQLSLLSRSSCAKRMERSARFSSVTGTVWSMQFPAPAGVPPSALHIAASRDTKAAASSHNWTERGVGYFRLQSWRPSVPDSMQSVGAANAIGAVGMARR